MCIRDRYTEAATEMWDKALADANAEGHSFTTADFAFPDWDPTRNFTVEEDVYKRQDLHRPANDAHRPSCLNLKAAL